MKNVPKFVRKNMKFNLGLFIINYSSYEIGSVIIQNNLSVPVSYELINSENDFFQKDLCNRKTYLKPENNLNIKFKLDKSKKLKECLASSKFKINLYDERDKFCDSCEIEVSIYIINLILKISLNNEIFSMKENTIYINHHVQNLNISYEFPGNRMPKLGIHLKCAI